MLCEFKLGPLCHENSLLSQSDDRTWGVGIAFETL